jgi:PadR family transcriptional regulator PadR
MKFNRELLKGHLKILILSSLSDGPCHAYGLIRRLQEKSLDVFSLAEGTIYPTLHKLEAEGLIRSEWEEREKGPDIRNYSLTPKGQNVLKEGRRDWNYFSRAMNLVLENNTTR